MGKDKSPLYYSYSPILPRYVSNPEGVTTDWLKSGTYEIESMGQRHAATLHMKSPFDATNARVKVSSFLVDF